MLRSVGLSSSGALSVALSLSVAVGLSAAATSCAGLPPPGRSTFEPDLHAQARNLAADGDVARAELYRSASQSVLLARVEGSIPSHRHLHSEETVYMLEGKGTLEVGGATRSVRAGDFVVVPRNTPHAYTPVGEEPTVVLSVFTPSLREGDRILDAE